MPEEEGNNEFELEEEFEDFFSDDDAITQVDKEMIIDWDSKMADFKYWLSKYAMDRVRRNQNFICLFVGQTGTSKSYSCIELAFDLDPDFDADRIVFKPEDFLELTKKKIPKGSVIMWDEVGVGMSSREWYSIQNKMISYVLETFRRDNTILLMTTPNMKFIDSNVRALIHGFGETIDPVHAGNQFGWVKYFHIVQNLREGKVMYRYPRLKDKYGMIKTMRGDNPNSGNMLFHKPPEYITEPYEVKKMEFTEELKEKALELIKGAEEGRKSNKFTAPQIMEIIQADPDVYGINEDITETELKSIICMELQLRHPGMKFSMQDIVTSVKYMQTRGFVSTKTTEVLDDSMLNTTKTLHNQHNDYRKVAKDLDKDKEIVKRSIRKWKERGMWNDD